MIIHFFQSITRYLRDHDMYLGILAEIGYVLVTSAVGFGICLILQELVR